MNNTPIGVFDSGFGGLTVLNEIINVLPNESILYFGDCGRAPYGNKSKEMITRYALQDCKFLLNRGVKMIVIACNTVSACSIDILKQKFDVPIVGVILPSVKAAINITKNNKIGVIGTKATIGSTIYKQAIESYGSSYKVFSKACPLFVPLVEEGWWENNVTYDISKEYLNGLKNKNIDTLILGCTHYPLLRNTIQKIIGDNIQCVNSALEVANFVKKELKAENILSETQIEPTYSYFTSDCTKKFKSIAKMILNKDLLSVSRVDIEKY